MFGETAATLQLGIENNQYFLEKGRYLIGNDRRRGRSRNYIQVTNLYVDAKHCVLEVDSNEEIFIVDLESDSGVYINNKRVDPLTKERLKPDEDFSLGEQLKATIRLIEREESHNGNHLENKSVIKDAMPRPILKDERVQQLHLENRISHDNHDSINVPAVQSHQPISTCSAARATNIDNSVNQNSPNGDQEVGNVSMPEIQEVKIEYPDSGDYNFIQSVPMILLVPIRTGEGESDSAQLISKKTEKTKNVEMLSPHVTSCSQQAERAQISHATTSFQGSIQNNKKIIKKGLENKKAIAGREKESNKSTSNDGKESSYRSESAVPKTKKKSNMSTRNIATQEMPGRRSTRCYTLVCDPRCFNKLPENNESASKRVTRSQTRKQETSNNTEHEMPSRRLTRSYTQEWERTRFIELVGNGNKTQKVNVTRSNVRKKERDTSLPLPSDVVPTQPLAHFMETRANHPSSSNVNNAGSSGNVANRSSSSNVNNAGSSGNVVNRPSSSNANNAGSSGNVANRPSSSNANNAGSSGNVAKRKGGAKVNSKKSKYPKKKDC